MTVCLQWVSLPFPVASGACWSPDLTQPLAQDLGARVFTGLPTPLSPPASPPLKDWPFDDGAPPPGKVVEDWLSLLKAKFCDDPGSCVAVHCVAGLGR